MFAAEHGDSNAVKFLINSGLNVNVEVNEKKAVDLAWNNQHFEIVLDLLMENSHFPKDFEVGLATKEIQEFVDITGCLHDFILSENLEVIGRILKKYPNLRHFYSISNISAPAQALSNKKFKVYEFLIANNVYIGPDEKIDEILKKISKSSRKDLKKIHLKYLKNIKGNHLIILALNSAINEEAADNEENREHIRNAYKFLDQIDPFCSLILQIVAASRDFRIIFDFSSSASNATVCTKSDNIREILIPAASLLDSSKVLGVYGILISE
jgi:hypothetical protein